ncbi:MAG: signal peptide peptidase SppA [Candidatus Eisenbacteria bacterium]|uniref:Signal peptide peptidase SppA n=1 Tax=Eiseniibacteriota bacterium TaxID=2212470 RepID=A0A933W3Z5_UNCEI|nr:signal peptide peptidase SppA [Candidatus Eisenbacteria bacterium]
MASRSKAFGLILLCVVLGALGLTAVTRLRNPSKPAASKSLLVYEVPGEIEESHATTTSFSLASLRPDRPTLFEVTDALRRAAGDDHVKGLALHIGEVRWGWARVAEFREALAEFRRSGKPIYASFSGGGEQAYLIACSADHLSMPPTADLGLDGLSISATFMKGTYDKLGIRPNFAHVGTFKSAVEQYTRENLSPDARIALEALLDDTFGLLVDSLASARRIPRDSVARLIDRGPFSAGDALAAGLVDTLLHEMDLDSLAARAVSRKPVDPLPFTKYLANEGLDDPTATVFALVSAEGAIAPGKDRDDPFGGRTLGGETLRDALLAAGRKDEVKAVILRIDSPGGSGQASDDVWREVRRLRLKKPVIVSMSNLAASGGYYIACGADAIVADPATITGSIGVFGGKLNILGLYHKLGLTIETVSRGRNASMLSPYEDFSPEAAAKFQQQMDAFYRTFLARVAEGRQMDATAVDSIAQGRVWTGLSAKRLGLVDTLGGLSTAVALARQHAKVAEGSSVRLEPFPSPHRAFWQNAFESFLEDEEEARMTKSVPELLATWLHASTFPAGTVLALMPFTLEIR